MADDSKKSGDKSDKKAKADKASAEPKVAKAPKAEKAAKGDRSTRADQPKAAAAPRAAENREPPRLLGHYRKQIVGALMTEFSYGTTMQVPRVKKVVLNIGLGEAVGNPNLIKTAVEELSDIAGQRAVITRAKKAIANFKLRAGLPIGCMVTLRGERMWEFLERLISVALPRVRDFKGISSKAFDGRGNYSLGIREHIIFPEINYDKVDKVKGFNVTIETSANTDEEGRALLKHLGMPFRT